MPDNPLAHLIPSAQEVGLLLANRFSKQALTFSTVKDKDLPGDGYKVACEWYGSLGIAKHTGSQGLLANLVTKFDPFKANFVANMLETAHVDRYIFGIVPLEIYLQTGTAEYLPLGIQVAENQQTTSQTRAAIDDMFMMTILQLQAHRAAKKQPTGRPDKFLEFMAPIMVKYLMAQKPNGLFFHNDKEGPVHWGRGNGWFAAGMAEMLRDLPPSASEYATILGGYDKMMEGLAEIPEQERALVPSLGPAE
jgi:unsaturated rhamnogalacturonyl hydrolase